MVADNTLVMLRTALVVATAAVPIVRQLLATHNELLLVDIVEVVTVVLFRHTSIEHPLSPLPEAEPETLVMLFSPFDPCTWPSKAK